MESGAAGPPGKRRRAGQPGTPAAPEAVAEALAAGPTVDEPGEEAEQLAARRAQWRVFAPSELVEIVPEWMFTKQALEAWRSRGPETEPGPGTQAAGSGADRAGASTGEQKVDPGYALLDFSGGAGGAVEVDLGAGTGGGEPAAGGGALERSPGSSDRTLYIDESPPRSRGGASGV